MNFKRTLVLTLAAASFGLSACGTLPSASTASLTGTDAGTLSTLSAAGSTSAEGRGTKGERGGPGRGGHGGHGGFGPIGGHLLAGLSLSDAQKTQIAALQTEARAFFEANKPAEPSSDAQSDREAASAAFEAAFKSDSFDPAALSASQPERPAPSDAMIDFQVEQLVKLHGILTAEQRAQIASADAGKTMPSPPADAADRETQRLDKLATGLNLSEAQKSQLQAIFSADAASRQSEMESRRSEMEAERTAFTNLIKADSIDKAALKSLLTARFAQEPQAGHLEQLARIHAVLTSEQRAAYLSLKGTLGGSGGPGRPGGPGGRGGHGGPGGGFGGNGMGRPPMAAPAQ